MDIEEFFVLDEESVGALFQHKRAFVGIRRMTMSILLANRDIDRVAQHDLATRIPRHECTKAMFLLVMIQDDCFVMIQSANDAGSKGIGSRMPPRNKRARH